VNWADQRNGKDNTDIWLKKSTDGGKTWSTDIKVNADNSDRHQFLSWITVDPSTGYLYVVYYDRRKTVGNQTDVYLSVSKDGGSTFKDYKINTTSFLPNDEVFFGDYTNISAQNGVIRPIWTQLENREITLYTAIVNQSDL
jgi:Neuraminidase (sialidase)